MSFDPNVAFGILIKILKFCGCWIDESSSALFKKYSAVIQLLLLYISTVLILVAAFQSESLKEVAEILCLSLTFFLACLKAINLIWRFGKVRELLIMIKSVLDTEGLYQWASSRNSENFKSNIERAQKLFKVYWLTGITTVLSKILQPIVNNKPIIKMWFPFEIEGSKLTLYPVAFFQLMSGLHNCSIVIALDMLPIFSINYAIFFTEVLCDRLEDFKMQADLGNDENLKKLKQCIELQVAIKQIVAKIEEIFSNVLLLQGIMSVAILCFISFSMTVVSFS